LERKPITDVVKIAAYNGQSWLADRLARHDANSNDRYDLLRAFAHLSGTLIRQADGGLRVCLQPPDLPLQRRALTGLCVELNQDRPVFPGTNTYVQRLVGQAGSQVGQVRTQQAVALVGGEPSQWLSGVLTAACGELPQPVRVQPPVGRGQVEPPKIGESIEHLAQALGRGELWRLAQPAQTGSRP
jgi:hypothetical protein